MTPADPAPVTILTKNFQAAFGGSDRHIRRTQNAAQQIESQRMAGGFREFPLSGRFVFPAGWKGGTRRQFASQHVIAA